LDLLHGRQQTVGETAGNFRMSRPAISKHLRLLRSAGLVATRQEGTTNEPEREPETRREPETKPSGLSIAELSGTWSLTGAMQNGTSLSGQAYLNQNLTFQTGAQGVVTAAGAWNIDASRRTVHLQGRHVLYGTPANFICTLAAEDTSGRSLQGTCTDFAGTGSLRLAH
jgi:hypothetical protein